MAQSPRPSAWPVSKVSSAGKPLPTQPSRTCQQVSHLMTLPRSLSEDITPSSVSQDNAISPDSCPAFKAINNLNPHFCLKESTHTGLANALSHTCRSLWTPSLYPSKDAKLQYLKDLSRYLFYKKPSLLTLSKKDFSPLTSDSPQCLWSL